MRSKDREEEKGNCPECGMPWVRVMVKKSSTMNIRVRDAKKEILHKKSGFDTSATENEVLNYGKEESGYSQTLSWRPSCNCNAGDPVPTIVLDPFAGAGTTCMIAKELGRDCVGIELKKEYCEMAEKRIKGSSFQIKIEEEG